MDQFVAEILRKFDGNPSRIGDFFGTHLSFQEELTLGKIDQQMGMVVDRVMDLSLSNANCINLGEIVIGHRERVHLMELTAIRCAIHKLIAERGQLNAWKEALN